MATELTDEVSNEVEVNTSSTASGPPSPQGEGFHVALLFGSMFSRGDMRFIGGSSGSEAA